MRLTKEQISIIKALVSQHFDDDTDVILFGSRVDDTARGGDIDLYIETNCSAEQELSNKMALYAGLQKKLGEQRIDIVIHRTDSPLQPVHEQARRTGIQL